MAAAAAVLFAAVLFLSENSPLQSATNVGVSQYVSLGEALLHGIDSPEGTVSSRMPVVAVAAALFFSHSDGVLLKFWEVLPLLLIPLLLLALGVLIGSVEYALVGVSLFHLTALFWSDGFTWTYPQSYFSVYLLLVACALVWRSQSPGPERSAGVGLVLGISLLYRSSLAFFPLLLVLVELLTVRRGSEKAALKGSWPLLFVPYLFLLPILRANWILHGQFFVFEWGPPDNNIITAALGFVPTVEGSWRAYIENPPVLTRYGDALKWGLERIGENPFRYAYSCLMRVVYVLSLKPLLFGLAAASLWAGRHNRALQALGLLAAYFIGIHCLMSVSPAYFVPLWPILAAMGAFAPIYAAGSLAARWKSKNSRLGSKFRDDVYRTEARWAAAARCCAAGVVAAILPLTLFSLRVSYAYADLSRLRLPDSREALEGGLREAPNDPWLRMRLGRELVREGRYQDAVREYEAALAQKPGNGDWALEAAWAHMLAGREGPIRDFEAGTHDLRMQRDLILYIADMRAGRPGPARDHLDRAWAVWKKEHIVVRRVETELEKRTLAKLMEQDRTAFIEESVRRWGDLLAADDRLLLFSGLSGSGTRDANVFLDQAEFARDAGDRETAVGFLGKVRGISLNREQSRRAARLYSDIGRPRRALEISGEFVRQYPKDADLWIDRAGYAKAAGDRRLSEKSLARARELGPSVREWRRVALLHQKWKNYSRAIEILGPLTKDKETAAAAFRDRGICEYLNGSADRAIDDLRLALKREPGMLSAALTLGVLYSSRDEFDREAEVYTKALRIAPNKGERSLRPLIVENLKRVRERGGS